MIGSAEDSVLDGLRRVCALKAHKQTRVRGMASAYDTVTRAMERFGVSGSRGWPRSLPGLRREPKLSHRSGRFAGLGRQPERLALCWAFLRLGRQSKLGPRGGRGGRADR